MSDSIMPTRNGLVVGTAGHIDHGKTSLVYALTGIDTDRLTEEKQRGISIDLGFAQAQMSDGLCVSFVDVPGHERFVRNMLAGAAGIEAVMLIVAANESVKPQTCEHFEICKLLGVQHGIVVISKTDLASTDQLQQTRADIQRLVAGSFLEAAATVEVSVMNNSGISELRSELSRIAAHGTMRDADGVMRLPIDRAFALKGFGTVVTGTLLAGSVKLGEMLMLFPINRNVRVRGLQVQHSQLEQAAAGQRLAINLSGVEHQDVKRGFLLTAGDSLNKTRLVDVELSWLDGQLSPTQREIFVLHAGTAEVPVHISRNENFARLRLKEDLMLVPGDRFVIRRPSPAQTVGGGRVIDAFPPSRLNRQKTLARLQYLRMATLAQRIEFLLNETSAGLPLNEIVGRTGSSVQQIRSQFETNPAIVLTASQHAVTRDWLTKKRKLLISWLENFHKLNPNSAGAPLSAARLGLDPALAALVMKDTPAITVKGETVALATHASAYSPAEAAALAKIESVFRTAAFQPPSAKDVLALSGVDAKKARSLLDSLIKAHRLVKLPDDLIFHADVISHIRTSLAQHKGRKFSVAEFKSWINISRKFAIPLLEYLDLQRITRRDGDMRIVL